jgi:hypothetical protein
LPVSCIRPLAAPIRRSRRRTNLPPQRVTRPKQDLAGIGYAEGFGGQIIAVRREPSGKDTRNS